MSNLKDEIRDLIIELKELTAILSQIWKKMEVDDDNLKTGGGQ